MFLKDSWLTTLRAVVRSSLRDIGKGWFNLEETNWEVYRMSKISKLMESVRFMMQVGVKFRLWFLISSSDMAIAIVIGQRVSPLICESHLRATVFSHCPIGLERCYWILINALVRHWSELETSYDDLSFCMNF